MNKTNIYSANFYQWKMNVNHKNKKNIKELKTKNKKNKRMTDSVKTSTIELNYKWKITIDIMMIVGKYFKTNKDFINVMKLTKKYHDLTQMYHFNPISDC